MNCENIDPTTQVPIDSYITVQEKLTDNEIRNLARIKVKIDEQNNDSLAQYRILSGQKIDISDNTTKGLIKDIKWYDEQISNLENTKPSFTKRGQGLEYQKQLKELEKQRAYILGEDPKKEKGSKRERKAIDFTETISGIELMKAENEREKAILEEKMNDENTIFSERLKLREEFSLKSLEILDDEYKKEQAIINRKGLDDFREVSRGLKNGDIKSEEEAQKQKLAIANRVNNELAKLDIDHSTKIQGIWDDDSDYYKKIQKEKENITKETADIIRDIEKEKLDKIIDNDELGVNYSLQVREEAHKKKIALLEEEMRLEYAKAIWEAHGDPLKIAKANADYDKLQQTIKNIISPTQKVGEETRKWIEGLTDGSLDSALDNIGLKSSKMFLDFDGNGKATFDKLMEGAKQTESVLDDVAVAFQAFGDVVQDAMAIADQADEERYQRRLDRLEKEKQIALSFAGDSAAAKAKIEADFDKKRKELEVKEFKRKKKMALANIAIDTAQAIAATIGKTGFSGIPLAAIVGALGAVQIAMVLAQKPPEYWTGTDNAEAGLAWTQERGAEIVTDKKGNIKDFGSSKGAKLTMMESGDKVYNAEATKRMMFNNELNSIMTDNGISNAPQIVVNSGMTKSEMREVMIETLGGQPKVIHNVDKNGFHTYIEKNGNITRRAEQRGSAIGLTF